MGLLSEEEIYNGTKRLLKSKGFLILAGQPPRGADHLPVVEIKSGTNLAKGSRDSFKPDLIAYHNNCFYVIECKPVYRESDIKKLEKVISSDSRLKCLYEELKQRGLLSKVSWKGDLEAFKKSLIMTHAYNGASISCDAGICHILVKNIEGDGEIIHSN